MNRRVKVTSFVLAVMAIAFIVLLVLPDTSPEHVARAQRRAVQVEPELRSTDDSPCESTDSRKLEPSEKAMIEVSGVVLGVGGEPIARGATVFLEGARPETGVIASGSTGDMGSFAFSCVAPAEPQRILLWARSNDTRSAPYAFLSSGQSRCREGIALRLAHLASIKCQVVDTDGQPIPGAEVLLREHLPNAVKYSLPAWRSNEGISYERFVQCNSHGRIEVLVRPGLLDVSARHPEGPLCPVQEVTVQAGEALDLGALAVEREGIVVRLAIVDATSRTGISGAAIRTPDRRISVLAGHCQTEYYHLCTDSRGRAELPALPHSSFPLALAIGSARYHVVELHVTAPQALAGVIDIPLQSRPSAGIQLGGFSGKLEQFSGRVRWEIVPMSAAHVSEGHGQPSIGRALRVDFDRPKVVSGPTLESFTAIADYEGVYCVTCYVPGGVKIVRDVRLSCTPWPDRETFVVPRGRAVRLLIPGRRSNPRSETVRRRLLLQWKDSSGNIVLQGAWRSEAGPSDPLWILDSAVELTVSTGSRHSIPVQMVSALVPRGDSTLRLDLPLVQETKVFCRVQWRGRRMPWKGVRVRLYTLKPGGGFGRIRTARTNASGQATIQLPPGRYKAKLEPTQWRSKGKEFTVEASEIEQTVCLEIHEGE